MLHNNDPDETHIQQMFYGYIVFAIIALIAILMVISYMTTQPKVNGSENVTVPDPTQPITTKTN